MAISPEILTREEIVGSVPTHVDDEYHTYWRNTPLDKLLCNAPEAKRYGDCDLVIFNPDNKDSNNTSSTTVLFLEHMQPLSPGNIVRAEAIRRKINPSGRLVFVPQNAPGMAHVDFSGLNAEQKRLVMDGDQTIYGGIVMDCLEKADLIHDFGELNFVGSSYGVSLALGVVACGSSDVSVKSVTGFAPVSKADRGVIGLTSDLLKSGSSVASAIRASQVSAQQELLDRANLKKEFIKFVVGNIFDADSRMFGLSMRGSMGGLLESAVGQIGENTISLFVVQGDRMFDRKSIPDKLNDKLRYVEIIGDQTYGHASVSDLELYGGVACTGLLRA